MKGFNANIEKATLENSDFRHVLYTGRHSQLVLMNLAPSEEIGMETHTDNDQFFRFEKGAGKCIIDGNEYAVTDGSAIVVPAGAEHNVITLPTRSRSSSTPSTLRHTTKMALCALRKRMLKRMARNTTANRLNNFLNLKLRHYHVAEFLLHCPNKTLTNYRSP